MKTIDNERGPFYYPHCFGKWIAGKTKKMWETITAWLGEHWWEVLKIGVTILLAIPGFLAFRWLRRERCYGKPLSIHVEIIEKTTFGYFPTMLDFEALEMTFLNPNPFTVEITEIKLCDKKGFLGVGKTAGDMEGAYVVCYDEDCPTTLKLPLAIRPSTLTEGKPLQTGTKELKAIFFVNKDVIKRSKGKFKLRFKCEPTNPKKRKSVVYAKNTFLVPADTLKIK